MYKSIHHNGKRLLVDNANYLKKHNIVYQTPAYKGYDGMPLGNGDVGGMLYNTPDSLKILINKTDVINFGKDGNFEAWAWKSEEENTAPVSCGEISISDGMPSFDWPYLNSFTQTLCLADGCIVSKSNTPFSGYEYRSYVAEEPSVVVFEIEATSVEAVERTIKLNKWSSPHFFHYYEQIKDTKDRHPLIATSGEKDGCLYIKQELEGTQYIIAMKLLGVDALAKTSNSRCCEFILPKSTKQKFTLLTTVVTAHNGAPKLEDAINNLNKAQSKKENLFVEHQKKWHDFWAKSFVSLQDSEDYLENIYYMNLYQLNSCSRGKYPITFAGLWSWFKDSRNWGHYYHWNHQQTYWGVYATNHAELGKNYLDYRFNMLKNAISDGQKLFDSNGAYFSDVTNLNGYNALEPDTVKNFTVGPQIAMDFYRCYQYNQDQEFLVEKAYPMMKACADLYCDVLQKGEDGYYRINGGATSYESYWNLKETSTDYGTIIILLNALIGIKDIVGLEESVQKQYMDILDNLYSLSTTIAQHGDKELEILSVGKKWSDESAQYCEGDYPFSPFPASELSIVYPTGLIGIAQSENNLFEVARNTARVIFDDDVYESSKMGTSGHAVMPQIAARLGMRQDCLKILNKYVNDYQAFPNGLTHYANINENKIWSDKFKVRLLKDEKNTVWSELHEKSAGNRVEISSEPFLHCYFESGANIMTGINEMLLQSYDNIIRLFPATPENYTAIFTLLSTGGFLVTSEIDHGQVSYCFIQSQLGGTCKIYSPWENECLAITCNKERIAYKQSNGVISFDTQKGQEYVITRSEYPMENYYKNKIESLENMKPKEFGNNILGQKRIYG